VVDRTYWTVGSLQEVVELSAILSVTTAMIVNPGNAPLSADSFVESAMRAVHVFIVLLVAVYVNISIN